MVATESNVPGILERGIFWSASVLGTLILLFALLLAQVPRLRHGADFSLDYICWSSSTILMICLLVGKHMWKRWYPSEGSGIAVYSAFYVAWFGLALSLYAFIDFAAHR